MWSVKWFRWIDGEQFCNTKQSSKAKSKKSTAEAHFLRCCILWNVKYTCQLCLLADHLLDGRISEAINLPTEFEHGDYRNTGWKYVGRTCLLSPHSWGSLWSFRILQLKFSYIHYEIAEMVVFKIALNLVCLALDEACHRVGIHVQVGPCYGFHISFKWESGLFPTPGNTCAGLVGDRKKKQVPPLPLQATEEQSEKYWHADWGVLSWRYLRDVLKPYQIFTMLLEEPRICEFTMLFFFFFLNC